MKHLGIAVFVLLAFACKSQKNVSADTSIVKENSTHLKGILQKSKGCNYPLIQSISSTGDTLTLIVISGLSGKEKEGSTVLFEYQPLRMPQPGGCKGIPASVTLR